MNRPLRIVLRVAGAVALAGFLTSCSDPYGYGAPATKRGAVIGGLAGAGVGAIIGDESCRALEGAAIGGAVGALGGALVGSAIDDERRYYEASGKPYYNPPPSGYYREPYYGGRYYALVFATAGPSGR